MNTHPLPIVGPWKFGFTLDQHTVSSEFLGYDLDERPIFDTTRSEVGELLFQCKYRGDRAACAQLAEAAAEFLRSKGAVVNAVVPVPPSKIRSFQPLAAIAAQLATRLGVMCDTGSLRKVKETAELKGVEDLAERQDALADAFGIQGNALRGKSVLLFDDLYRSGASMSAAAHTLTDQGGVASIVALALTRTRSRT